MSKIKPSISLDPPVAAFGKGKYRTPQAAGQTGKSAAQQQEGFREVREAFRRGSLVPLAVPHRDFSREFYFVLHRQKYRSPGVERWLQLCRESRDQG